MFLIGLKRMIDYSNFEQLSTKDRLIQLIKVVDAPNKPFPPKEPGTQVFYNMEHYYNEDLVQLRGLLQDKGFLAEHPTIMPMIKVISKNLSDSVVGSEVDPKVLETCISEFEKIYLAV